MDLLDNTPAGSTSHDDTPTPALPPRGLAAIRSIPRQFRSTIWTPFMRGLGEYRLLSTGDRVAVCISGGKDSMLLAVLFQELLRHRWIDAEVVFLAMDPGYSQATMDTIRANAALLGIPLIVRANRIFDAVAEMDGGPCYPCARMRRGALYDLAAELGCNKIALGHHYDDVIETVLLSVLYGGQVKTMMPKLHSTNHPGMELIRPLYLVREASICSWRDANGLQFVHNACPLAGACSNGESKRDEVKRLIAQLEAQNPQVPRSIFHSVDNIKLDAVTGHSWKGTKHGFLEWYDEA